MEVFAALPAGMNGTHYGIYTVGIAIGVGSEGQVIGFEPLRAKMKEYIVLIMAPF